MTKYVQLFWNEDLIPTKSNIKFEEKKQKYEKVAKVIRIVVCEYLKNQFGVRPK